MQDNLTLQDLVDDLDKPRPRTSGIWRVAVAGEFESGKSSVINAMLRKPLLPCNPGFVGRPMIRINDGAGLTITAEDRTGQEMQPETLDELVDVERLASCTISTSMNMLRGIEVVEVPFHHEGGIAAKDIEMIADADLIIWCTIASQAWRLSEKAIIEGLPWHAREKSILAISRADKLPSPEDLDKIETRLQKDASRFFSEIVFMQASTEYLSRCANDARIWEETGGAALASIAHELVVLPMQASKAGAA